MNFKIDLSKCKLILSSIEYDPDSHSPRDNNYPPPFFAQAVHSRLFFVVFNSSPDKESKRVSEGNFGLVNLRVENGAFTDIMFSGKTFAPTSVSVGRVDKSSLLLFWERVAQPEKDPINVTNTKMLNNIV